jgi:uncharacterized membrane protein YkoI
MGMKKTIMAVGLVGLFMVTGVPAWALFESDRTLTKEATVSMVEAIQAAQKAHSGKPVEVSMGKEDDRVIYKIEMVDADETHEVYVDAKTGKVKTDE